MRHAVDAVAYFAIGAQAVLVPVTAAASSHKIFELHVLH